MRTVAALAGPDPFSWWPGPSQRHPWRMLRQPLACSYPCPCPCCSCRLCLSHSLPLPLSLSLLSSLCPFLCCLFLCCLFLYCLFLSGRNGPCSFRTEAGWRGPLSPISLGSPICEDWNHNAKRIRLKLSIFAWSKIYFLVSTLRFLSMTFLVKHPIIYLSIYLSS